MPSIFRLDPFFKIRNFAMFKQILALSLSGLLSLSALAAPLKVGQAKVEQIRVVSEVWDNATEKSGRGLYWELLRRIYAKENIRLDFETMPYIRSVKLVQAGEADAWIGASMNEVANVIYPSLPIDEDRYYALYLKGKVADWQGQESLQGKRIGWVRGYALDQYLKVEVQPEEFLKLNVGFNRLDSGELDFILDAKYDLEQAMLKFGEDSSKYEMQKLITLPTFLAFANNDRGRYLADLYDKQLQAMLASGEVRALFDEYQWPSYPFED
jgi:polar amino acid transport system substrate-binding protein